MKIGSKTYLKIAVISAIAFLPVLIVSGITTGAVQTLFALLFLLDIGAIIAGFSLWSSESKKEKEKARIKEAAKKMVELQMQYEAKKEELQTVYENHYKDFLDSAMQTIDFKLQKTNKPDRQKNISESYLYEPLRLEESISDDSFTVYSSAGIIGEINNADAKRLSELNEYTAFYSEKLCNESEGIYGIKVKAIKTSPETN